MSVAAPYPPDSPYLSPLPPAIDPLGTVPGPDSVADPAAPPTLEDALTLLIQMQAVQLAGIEAALHDMRETHVRVLAMMRRAQANKAR